MVVTVVMPMKPKGADEPEPPKRRRVVLLLVCLVGVIAGLVMAVESVSPRDRSPATQAKPASRAATSTAASGPGSQSQPK